MIALAIPTYRRFDLLADCIASANAGSMRPDRILVVDNSGGQCPPIVGAEMLLGRQPQSVAKAWNDAVQTIGGDCILANDDILFASNTIEILLAEAARNPQSGIVSPIEGQRFSLFWLRYAAYQEIGGFDEGFQSAYFEDNHAARLMELAGWQLAVAYSAVQHYGSATVRTYDHERREQHHREFRANEARYIRMWGGLPHHERYSEPRE